MTAALASTLALLSCAVITESDTQARLDPDADGILWPHDCDESDSSVGLREWFPDLDNDGWGIDGEPVTSCEDLDRGWAEATGDCDDANEDINPGMPELCDDRQTDENCNGLYDDDEEGVTGTSTFYVDNDQDGYGSEKEEPLELCQATSNTAQEGGDCNDNEPDVHPGAHERANKHDDNCDGDWNEGLMLYVSDFSGIPEVWVTNAH